MGSKVHPSQRREIDRHFHWKHGHDPNDPDTHPESGWHFYDIEYYTPADPDQRNLLTGGPDTGHTCYRCKNNTYRVAAERDMEWVMTQPGVEVLNLESISKEELKNESIVIWACPSCGDKVQWRRSEMPAFKEVK